MENKEEIIKKLDLILDRITIIDNEREELKKEMEDLIPIKKGDKISIKNREDNSHIRFAFVIDIKIHSRGKDRKATLEFDLQKCKADGTISQHSDYPKYGEYISKINLDNSK